MNYILVLGFILLTLGCVANTTTNTTTEDNSANGTTLHDVVNPSTTFTGFWCGHKMGNFTVLQGARDVETNTLRLVLMNQTGVPVTNMQFSVVEKEGTPVSLSATPDSFLPNETKTFAVTPFPSSEIGEKDWEITIAYNAEQIPQTLKAKGHCIWTDKGFNIQSPPYP